MATALYATMLTHPASVETIQRYLYSTTEIVEAAPIVEYREGGEPETGRLVFLILRTEERNDVEAANSQQYQIDRLASGMHGATGGFATRWDAEQHAHQRASDNDWGMRTFSPFVVAAVSA